MAQKIGVFVAWPYANGDLHLGHIAGAYLPADIFARFHRLVGNDVMMVSGSDAHGTPITLKSKQEQVEPIEIVTRYHERFLDGWQKLGISFDLFTHTHTQNHIALSQEIFSKLQANGDLKVATQEQFFDVQEKLFLPDRYVRGTCPFCGYDRARGDQCENCGKTFETKELVNPISSLSDSTPVLKDTDHFFFLMNNYQEKLMNFIQTKDFWRPQVQNMTKSMVADGLRERAITRDISWGVPVPVEGWESKVLYVWFDAVIGYLSASKEWSIHEEDDDKWKQWWYEDSAKSYYFIGKDNIPFHSIIWPVELMAYDEKLNLPYDVPANQFLNIDGEKFSTSRGLAVWLLGVLETFDVDAVRYYLASIMPESKDANFSWEEMITRNNGELVAAWGNLVNRVFGFAYKRYDAKIPEPQELGELDKNLLESIKNGFDVVASHYEKVELRDALKVTLALTREVNKYLDEKAPWTVFKTDPVAAGTSIYVAMKVIDSLKVMFAPVLPNTCEQLHRAFGYSEPLFGTLVRDASLETKEGKESNPSQVLRYQKNSSESANLSRWKMSELKAGQSFEKPGPLFKLLEQEMVE